MWPDRVSNLRPLTYESGALPTALRGPVHEYAKRHKMNYTQWHIFTNNYRSMNRDSVILDGPPMFANRAILVSVLYSIHFDRF